jgi:hypothetical protein
LVAPGADKESVADFHVGSGSSSFANDTGSLSAEKSQRKSGSWAGAKSQIFGAV